MREGSASLPNGTVYFVRHGLVHNPDRVAYGCLPGYGLAEVGRRQAAATAGFLAGEPISLLLSSPLLRAMQTRRILSQVMPNVPAGRSSLLIESGLARMWQGISWTDLPQRYPDDYHTWQEAPAELEAGESMANMAQRMRRALAYALRRSGGKPAVCVSHRDPILAIRLLVEGRSFNDLHTADCSPASVTIIRVAGGRPQLVRYLEPEIRDAVSSHG